MPQQPAVPEGGVAVLVPAAGAGRRMGGTRKQYRQLGGATLLVQTLRAFDRHPAVRHLVVATPAEDVDALSSALADAALPSLFAVVPGGATRQDSVAAALRAVPPDVDLVLVHDAVRPFVDAAMVDDVVAACRRHGAAAPALPVTDTVRRGEGDAFADLVPRDGLFRMQTPQGCRRDWFEAAHRAAAADGVQATDDVELVQRLGHRVVRVPGRAHNIKVTTPEDWTLAQVLWQLRSRG